MRHASFALRSLALAASLLTSGLSWSAPPSPVAEAVAIDALQGAYERAATPGDEAGLYRELIPTVLKRFKRSSAVQVDLTALAGDASKVLEPMPAGTGEPAAVFRKAIQAALQPVDAYSRYFDPRAWGSERGESSGNFVGIGIEVEGAPDSIRIAAPPMAGGPAARAGLMAGDLIVRVDDKPLAGVPLGDAIARIRGERGTAVSLTVQRTGRPAEFTVSLTRDTIRRQLLRSSLEGEVLVLRLSSFSGPAAKAIEDAVEEAVAQRIPRAVILDLRGNPGGLLREAVKVADAFLSQGEIASLSTDAGARRRVWEADPAELLAGVPMAVLIDARSASASELVADALQYNGRATVLGQRSYGKGSVQTTFPLGDDKGAIKFTTSLYHGPSGQTVNRVGVMPDIELLEPAKASTPRTMPAPTRDAKARIDATLCAPTATPDPALACAVSYLRTGNVDAFVAGLPQPTP